MTPLPSRLRFNFRGAEWQREVVEDQTSKILIAAIGRRGGKTTAQAQKLTATALQSPGEEGWFVGRTLTKASELKDALERDPGYRSLLLSGAAGIKNQFPRRHIFTNGFRLCFQSYDKPRNLLGSGLRIVAVDEATQCGETIFWQVLMPMLSKNGQAFLACNYNNGKDWFWKLAQKGKTPEGRAELHRTWEYDASVSPIFQGEAGRAKFEWYRRNTPLAIWESEYLNIPRAGEDAVLRWSDANERGRPLAGPTQGCTYVQGLDIGHTVDPSFSVVMETPADVRKAGQVVFAERFPLRMGYRQQAQKAAAIAKAWGAITVADDTGAKGGAAPAREPFWHLFKEEFNRAQQALKAFTWNSHSKFALMNNLAVEIDERLLFIPPPATYPQFAELVNQIHIYTARPGKWFAEFGAPKGEHDDGVAALAMAAWGKVRGWNHSNAGEMVKVLL